MKILTANFKNLASGKFGLLAAFAVGIAALLPHVPHVVSVRAEEQVLWSDTSRLVASMKDIHAFGDRPEMHFPRQAMGQHKALVVAEPSVSVNATGCPKPATTGFLYLGPETVRPTFSRAENPGLERIRACSGAASSAMDMAWLGQKQLATGPAPEFNPALRGSPGVVCGIAVSGTELPAKGLARYNRKPPSASGAPECNVPFFAVATRLTLHSATSLSRGQDGHDIAVPLFQDTQFCHAQADESSRDLKKLGNSETTVAVPLRDPKAPLLDPLLKMSEAVTTLAKSIEDLQAKPLEMHQTVTIDSWLAVGSGLLIGAIAALLIARRLYS